MERLCTTCSVIQFDDRILEPCVSSREDGKPYLDISKSLLRARDSFTKSDEFGLRYNVVDFLPSLPCLDQSGLGGCEFCALLRSEIIRTKFKYTGFIEITLAYHWVDKSFRGLGLAALVANVTWCNGCQQPRHLTSCATTLSLLWKDSECTRKRLRVPLSI